MLTRQLRVVAPDTNAVLKVAFATSDMKRVNQHFGSSESFAVYAVEPEASHLLEVAQFGHLAQDGNEDKLVAKIASLADCAAVYSQACGASAVRQLLAKGIQPVRVEAGTEIAGLIEALQHEIEDGPSAWLAKAIRQQQGCDMARFDAMEDEGWDEG
jgi:nitrogen fixation protein NifX